ncbi:hypothetical protein SAMN05444920_106261 [Nonomuraea solani]|uniref:Uncharacterized protein n=1 Tax=Nonomuraea solani TaxID=1144553 RepID=A0A1H6DVD8_9ACTN|nr:hypothetical protein [Nonomuraea solani]SEG88545.1 hypothetical protein SAMN05444920_106261 [Nonomuraea solani]
MHEIHQYDIGYEVATLPIVSLPALLDDAVVKERMGRSGLTQFSLRSVGDLSDQEALALKWLLAEYAVHGRGNKTFNQILPLGRAARGPVTLSYEGTKGTATLLGRELPLGGAPLVADDETLKRHLMRDYSFSAITGDWSQEELTKVYYALRHVKAADRPALHGLELARVGQLAADTQGGHRLALFSHVPDPIVGSPGRIRVADPTFEQDKVAFYGQSGTVIHPASAQILLHEVGHAVESLMPRSDARRNAGLAAESVGAGPYAANQTVPQEVIARALDLRYTELTEMNALLKLAFETVTALQKGSTDAATKRAACEAAGGKLRRLAQASQLDEARRLRDELQADYTALTSLYGDAIKVGNQGATASKEQFAHIVEEAGKLGDACWREFTQELVRWSEIRLLEVAWRSGHARLEPRRTGREQRFVAYVNTNGIRHDLTPYTTAYFQTSQAGGELYAEAFSLWLVHPEGLAEHSPALRAYFDDGQYRQDA